MRFVPAIIAALVVVGGDAFAQGAPSEHDPRAAHAASDANHDGQIDREEFHLRMVEIFFFSDGDRDGVVVVKELRTFDAPALFERADANDDDQLQMYEFIDARFDDFKTADQDADGLLTVEEVVEYFERNYPETSENR